jgi:hypothetical protein
MIGDMCKCKQNFARDGRKLIFLIHQITVTDKTMMTGLTGEG